MSDEVTVVPLTQAMVNDWIENEIYPVIGYAYEAIEVLRFPQGTIFNDAEAILFVGAVLRRKVVSS